MEVLDAQALADVDEKGFVPDEVRNSFFRKLRMKSDNRTCFECPARNPTWISLSYGVYLCLECSGEHRRKGVHISFVRSVELDRFSPDQMVQMGLGGNGKAWAHFKTHQMGKASESGRAVDYSSKIAVRYKQQLEKDTKDTCAKLRVACRTSSQAPALVDPIDEATEVAGPLTPDAVKPAASAPSLSNNMVKPTPVARSAAAPTTVVVRRTEVTTSLAPSPSVSSAATPAPVMVKPTGFAGSKQLAKEIDFDFDFDELESEASKPKPVVPPPTTAPTLAPSVTKPAASSTAAPTHIKSAEAADSQTTAKFSTKKGISSDDFFGDLEQETASWRMEREQRYNKFSSSSAISSSSFFANGAPEDVLPGDDNWKAKGAEYAKAGLSKGAEILTMYLNKVRD